MADQLPVFKFEIISSLSKRESVYQSRSWRYVMFILWRMRIDARCNWGRWLSEWRPGYHSIAEVGPFPFNQKIVELSRRVMMVRKFLWKVSEKCEHFWISGIRTIQPKIDEISEEKLRGRNILIAEFSKIWIYLARSSFFREFRKMLFLSSPKISGNSKSCFWSNRKAPRATGCLCFITRLGLDLGHYLQANQSHFDV